MSTLSNRQGEPCDLRLASRLAELILHLTPTNAKPGDLYRQHGLSRFLDAPTTHATAYGLKSLAFQKQIAAELQRRSIKYLCLKGHSLALVLYGKIGGREFGDLDLLVPPDQAQQAIDALEAIGLVRTYPPSLSARQQDALIRFGKAQNLVDAQQGMAVDLHWKLLSQWMGNDLFCFDSLWQESQTLRFQGLSWQTLGIRHTVVFLALHGYQDGWRSLKHLVDLTVALDRFDLDWASVLSAAGPRRPLVERAVDFAIVLLGARNPRPDPVCISYDRALSGWLAMATSAPPQWELLAPKHWDCSRGEALFRSIKAIVNPTVEDILSCDLSLPELYRLVRLWRLGKKILARRGLRPRTSRGETRPTRDAC